MERLPFGWTEQVAAKDGEQLKFYCNVITGHKFYCKADLLHYAKLGSPSLGTEQTRSPQNESKMMATETNNNPDWLPQGWLMEVKVGSDEKKRKVYTDPSTGRKFMSKPEVLKFLHSEKENDPMSEQTPMGVESDNNLLKGELSGAETPPKPEGSHTPKETSRQSGLKITSSCNSRKKKVEIVRCEAEGLPEGWIKEIKIERKGKTLRKDPYYTDPESKYVLRSMPDALRFLETKDLKSCAIRPRKREDLKFLSDDTSILEEKQSLDNKAEENIEKEEINAPKTDQPPKTPLSKRKRGRPRAASSTDSITKQEKPANDSTKSESENVNSTPSRKRGRPRAASSTDSITKQEKPVNDSTKFEGENVNSTPSRSSTRITRGNGGTEGKPEETLEPEHVKKLGGSSLDPLSEFAFKNLRSDIPVDANNLAAQGYDHQKRANFILPSFSDYARR